MRDRRRAAWRGAAERLEEIGKGPRSVTRDLEDCPAGGPAPVEFAVKRRGDTRHLRGSTSDIIPTGKRDCRRALRYAGWYHKLIWPRVLAMIPAVR